VTWEHCCKGERDSKSNILQIGKSQNLVHTGIGYKALEILEAKSAEKIIAYPVCQTK
jgi:hypothetical protein